MTDSSELMSTHVQGDLDRIGGKVMRSLLPVLCAAYFMSYIDRTNIAMAKSSLESDLAIGAAAYGLGAGVFFISYALLEVPSNLALHRFGPRLWITRITLAWGAICALTLFISGDMSFVAARFLLGAAEAGLYTAMMYVIATWLPDALLGVTKK
jgi:MFS family permease